MEEATHQTHRRHHPGTGTSIYLVLGVILMMPLLWQEFGSDEVRKWHPFFDVEYSLYWYIALTVYNLKPLLYLIVARLAKRKHHTLLAVFMGYEFILYIDHVLIYSQSPGTYIVGMSLALYMVYYHWKYG